MSLLGKLEITGFDEKPSMQNEVSVNQETLVSMLEYDLYLFNRKFPCADWTEMVRTWLKKGARIDFYFQRMHLLAGQNLRQLQQENPDKVSFYNMLGIPDGVIINANEKPIKSKTFLNKFKTFHFTLFQNPNQLWLEGTHLPRARFMYDCELFRPKDYDAMPERIREYEQIIKQLKIYCQPVKI